MKRRKGEGGRRGSAERSAEDEEEAELVWRRFRFRCGRRERMSECVPVCNSVCVCVCVSDCVLRRLRHVWRIVELHNMHFFIAAIRCEIYNATHIDLLPDNCPESSAATMPRAEWICVLASARPLPPPPHSLPLGLAWPALAPAFA